MLMLRTVALRLASGILMLVLISLLVFIVLRELPIDPVGMSLPPGATEADRLALTHEFGLDRPIPEQYAIWVQGLLRGEFGQSVNLRRQVGPLVASVLPATVELVVTALLLGIVIGLLAGLVLFAVRRTRWEMAGDVLTSILVSVPEFVWAIAGILLFGVWLRALPFIGRIDPDETVPTRTGFMLIDTLLAGRPGAFGDALAHLILPGLALGITLAPLIARVLRSSLLGVIVEDFIHLARLRGLTEWQVLTRHALRNAALPTLSLVGVQAGFMFGGTLLIEVIFGWPGLGNLMVTAVRSGDIPVIQAATLVYCIGVLLITLLVDIATVALNPRLRTR
jgi:ABC-type dipeptide/oligopeptide/nickel transport system permease component